MIYMSGSWDDNNIPYNTLLEKKQLVINGNWYNFREQNVVMRCIIGINICVK